MCGDLEEWWSHGQMLRRAVLRGRRANAPNVAVQCDGYWFVPFTEHLPGARRWAGCGACMGEPGRRGAYTLQRRGRQKGLQCSGVNRRGGRLTSTQQTFTAVPWDGPEQGTEDHWWVGPPDVLAQGDGEAARYRWPVWEYEAFSHNLFCLQTFVLKAHVHCLEFRRSGVEWIVDN